MVKKRLADGSQCRKCGQVTRLLEQRGHLGQIDETVCAKEGDPDSEGMRLAKEHGIDTAPFFIVTTDDDQGTKVYTSALRMMRDCFGYKASLIEELEEEARRD